MPRWTIPLVGRPDQEDGAFMDVRPGSPVLDSALRLTDGRMLCYAVWGDPRGRPVLLFHGSPASRLFRPDAAVTETLVFVSSPLIDPATGGPIPDRCAAFPIGRPTSHSWWTRSAWNGSGWWRIHLAAHTRSPLRCRYRIG